MVVVVRVRGSYLPKRWRVQGQSIESGRQNTGHGRHFRKTTVHTIFFSTKHQFQSTCMAGNDCASLRDAQSLVFMCEAALRAAKRPV